MGGIGETLRVVRKQRGLTQKDLAQTMAVSQSYICQVETGHTTPSPMFIKLFCLQYSIDERPLSS